MNLNQHLRRLRNERNQAKKLVAENASAPATELPAESAPHSAANDSAIPPTHDVDVTSTPAVNDEVAFTAPEDAAPIAAEAPTDQADSLPTHPAEAAIARKTADAGNKTTPVRARTTRKAERPSGPSAELGNVEQAFIAKYGHLVPAGYEFKGPILYGPASGSAAQSTAICMKPIVGTELLSEIVSGFSALKAVYIDVAGKEREILLPLTVLGAKDPEATRVLTQAGIPKLESGIFRYLMIVASSRKLRRRYLLRNLGFAFDPTDRKSMVFATPAGVLRARDASSPTTDTPFNVDQNLQLLLDAPKEQVDPFAPSGTLAGWQAMIEGARAHHLVIFGVCAAFAGLIAPLHGGGGVILHLWGRSTGGKTTALQASASVMGCGADPATARDATVIMRWNTTNGGLEMIAATRSGVCTQLDELGALFGEIDLYNPTSGQGRARMTRQLGFAEMRRWLLFALSSGEISMAQHFMLVAKRRMNPGETARGVDISADKIVDASPATNDEMKSISELVKAGSAMHYGIAGPTFAQRLMDKYPDADDLHRAVQAQVAASEAELLAHLDKREIALTAVQRRTLRHLAGVHAAGMLAEQLDVLPITADVVRAAVEATVMAWLDQDMPADDTEVAMSAMRNYALEHMAEFQDLDSDEPAARRSFGLRHRGLLLLSAAQFEAACGDLAPFQVKQLLRDNGVLKTESPEKLVYRVTNQRHGLRQAPFIALRWSQLFSGDETAQTEGEANGSSGPGGEVTPVASTTADEQPQHPANDGYMDDEAA
ncbi:hypothetical protein HNQ51_000127 [Inhella inkyongensis]|uniref:DUF927 domain-containing protein n=1 Tax=Inhella inkyongensis TaxID=392593 RepID=A0A840S1U9_9BURK|nr:DUF927 domain-containing protein [Inhella inkyongensis]MBB5202834.1 hypothetical protein [Inhella inkyongensis]